MIAIFWRFWEEGEVFFYLKLFFYNIRLIIYFCVILSIVSAMQWSGLKMATSFSPVCPQMLPDMKRETLSAGRYNYIKRLLPFLKNQSEDCLYLNLYVPHAGESNFNLLLDGAIKVRHSKAEGIVYIYVYFSNILEIRL